MFSAPSSSLTVVSHCTLCAGLFNTAHTQGKCASYIIHQKKHVEYGLGSTGQDWSSPQKGKPSSKGLTVGLAVKVGFSCGVFVLDY